MVSTNYFYLIIMICLYIVIWCQETNWCIKRLILSREILLLFPFMANSFTVKSEVIQSNPNKLYTVLWFQVFLSNPNNLHTVVWFQVFLSNTNSLYTWVECSPMVRETGVKSQVESYQRLKKMVLDAALLSTQHYKVRIKGKVEQSRERCSALPYTSV